MSRIALTLRGRKETPVFCDLISFVVLSESPVFIDVLSKSRLCARPFGKKHTGFPLDLLACQDGR